MADLVRIVPIPGGLVEERMGWVTPSVSKITRLDYSKKTRPEEFLIHLGAGVTLTLSRAELDALILELMAQSGVDG